MKASISLIFAGVLGLTAGGVFAAGQAGDESVANEWGKQLFLEHCAPCHGQDGRGAGPAAMALKTGPSDLTVISKTHDDKFPRLWVMKFIDGDSAVVPHGSREMPIWGRVFGRAGGDMEARAKIHALTSYIETIQQK